VRSTGRPKRVPDLKQLVGKLTDPAKGTAASAMPAAVRFMAR